MGFVSLLEDIEKRIERLNDEGAAGYAPSDNAIQAQKKRLEKEKLHLASVAQEIQALYRKIQRSILHPDSEKFSINVSLEILSRDHLKITSELRNLTERLKDLRRDETAILSKVRELESKLVRLRIWEKFINETEKSIGIKHKATFNNFINSGLQSFIANHPIVSKIRLESKKTEHDLRVELAKKDKTVADLRKELALEKKRIDYLRKQLAAAISARQKSTATITKKTD